MNSFGDKNGDADLRRHRAQSLTNFSALGLGQCKAEERKIPLLWEIMTASQLQDASLEHLSQCSKLIRIAPHLGCSLLLRVMGKIFPCLMVVQPTFGLVLHGRSKPTFVPDKTQACLACLFQCKSRLGCKLIVNCIKTFLCQTGIYCKLHSLGEPNN